MADRFPLILNTSTNQIQEIPSGDNLDLTGVGINNVGVITSGNVQIGGGTTDLVVTGDARITGILTVGTSSLKLDGPNNLVNVGTALTLGHTQGVQFHTQNLHSAGFEVNQINASGIITATEADINGDLDVDGHTNLDNVSVAGVSTFAGNADFSAGIDVTGNLIASGNLTANNGTVTVYGTAPKIVFSETNANPDYKLEANGGNIAFVDTSNSATRLSISSSGINVTGNGTFSGNVSVGGVLTYEDVTNVDSIGIITARNGINVSSGTATFQGAIDANGDLDVDGHTNLDNLSVAGVSTFTGNADFSAGIDVTGVIETTVAGADNMLKIKTTSSGDPILQFNAAGSGGHDIYYNRSTNELTFKSAGGSDRLKIAPHGDLLPAVDSQYNIGSSTVRFANIYADTLHGAGSNITALNGSNIASGTVPVARIGTGTKNSTTFYRGDGTFQVVSTDLVGDTSPQLGGDLSSNNFDIHISDNKSLEFGDTTSPDLYIKHSVGHNANFIVSYNGDIEHHMTSSKKIIKGFQNSGTPYVALYHNNTPKLLTEAGGINVKSPGSDWNNIERTSNGYYGFAFRKEDGSSFNGYLGFTGGGSEINNTSAAQDLVIRSETNIILSKGYSTRLLKTDSNGAVSLYYGNGEKFKTNSSGVDITGMADATGNSARFRSIESGGATVEIRSGGVEGYVGTQTDHKISFITNGNRTMTLLTNKSLCIGLKGTTGNTSPTSVIGWDLTDGWTKGVFSGGTGANTPWTLYNEHSNFNRYMAYIKFDGGVMSHQSNDGNLCDERIKQDFDTVSSQWDNIKNIGLKKFRYKNEPSDAKLKIGVIAQQVETIYPDLVDEDWPIGDANPNTHEKNTGEFYKSVKEEQLQMYSLKALQEAMARIEALEAEVAALKGS